MTEIFRKRGGILLMSVVTFTSVVLGSANATLSSVDLKTDTDVHIMDALGVARAGDVNGDGHIDVITTDCLSNDDPFVDVWFGPFMGGRLEAADIEQHGFGIKGSCLVTGGGDVNGDGLDDIIIGHPSAANNGDHSGSVYVVFGKTTNETVDLATFDDNTQGAQGFRIDGPYTFSLAGQVVAALGDVNGDGLADVGLAAPFADADYVVFGKADPAPIDLVQFESGAAMGRGYAIHTERVNDNAFLSVGGGDDVNGDGLADVLVGYSKDSTTGFAYVVFGKADDDARFVNDLGSGGFKIVGTSTSSATGHVVDRAGDLNHDGMADFFVTAPGGYCSCRDGAVYVIFGRSSTTTISLADLGSNGYVIWGAKFNDRTGVDVDTIGDLDGDGFDDAIVGTSTNKTFRRDRGGYAFVVYGKTTPTPIHLKRPKNHAFRIDGARAGDFAGAHVSGLGDVNEDGTPDYILQTNIRLRAFIVFGKPGR